MKLPLSSATNACLMDRRPVFTSFLILLFLMLGMMYRLSSLPLFEPDESRYVEVSREMLETGDYIIPHLNYEIRLSKPALYHWILALGFHTMGFNVFSARFISILASAALLAATGLFAWKYLGMNAKVPLSICVLGTSALFWWMSRIAMVDVFLCFSICSALFLLFDWEQNRSCMRSFWLTALAMALGVNLKGPVALALPLFIFWIYTTLKGEVKTVWKSAPWIRWILAVVLLSIPWYLLATIQLGRTAGQYFFIDELFGRFFTDQFNRSRPFYYFFMMTPILLLPWSLLFFRAFWSQRVNLRSQGLRYWMQNNPVHGYLIIWFLATLIFFSLCRSKMVHYLIPLTPPAALLTADWIDLWMRKRPRLLTWAAPLLIMAATGIALVVLSITMEPAQSGIPFLIICAVGSVLYIGYLFFFRFSGYLVHCLVFILPPIFFYNLVIAGLNRDSDIWPTDIEYAQFLRSWVTPETSIYSFYSFKPSLLTVLQRPIQKIGTLPDIEKVMQSEQPGLLLMTRNSVESTLQQNIQERDKEYLRKYIPFEKYALVYNKAYAHAYLFKDLELNMEPKGALRLIAVGEPGGFTREPYELSHVINRLVPSPDACVLLGDNVFLHPTRKFQRMDTVFGYPFQAMLERGIPFYAALGNSDQPIAESLVQYPLFHMQGKRFYSQSFGNGLLDCFFLDSEDFVDGSFWDDASQLDWLANSLENSKSIWKMIVLHRPLIAPPGDKDVSISLHIHEILEPILQKYQVPLALSGGGVHYSRILGKQHLTQFIVGAEGNASELKEPYKDKSIFSYTQNPVFMVMDLYLDRIQTTAVSLKGAIIDRYTMNYASRPIEIAHRN